MSIVSRIQNGEIASLSDNGPRASNEDREWVYAFQEGPDFPLRAVLAVADGAGGGDAGEVASQIAIQRLQQRVNRLVYEELVGTLRTMPPEELADSLEEMLDGSMDALQQEIRGMAELRSATTLTVAFLCQGFLVFGHVGDSRLYVATRSGLTQLTTDQKTTDTGAVMSLGSARMQPQIETHGLYGDALVILCSDGISDVLDERALLDELGRYGSAAQAANGLVEAARRRGTRDNCTVALGVDGNYRGALPPAMAQPAAGDLLQVPIHPDRLHAAPVAGDPGAGDYRRPIVAALLGLMLLCLAGIGVAFLRPQWLGLGADEADLELADAAEVDSSVFVENGALPADADSSGQGGPGAEAAEPGAGEPAGGADETLEEPAARPGPSAGPPAEAGAPAGPGQAPPLEPAGSIQSAPLEGRENWNRQRLAKLEREKAEAEQRTREQEEARRAAERRARKQEQARLEAERLADQRQREKETLGLQRAQREQDFQESVEDIQTRLDRGDLNSAEILLEGLERDHPDKPAVGLLRKSLDERRAAAAVAARQQQEAAAQRRRKEARSQELIPILRHHNKDRPTQGCFNQSIEYEIRGSRIRWPFYILAGEDRGDEIRPLLVRQLEDQTRERYRVFSNAGRQNDLGSMKETFANWAGKLRKVGRVTFFLLYPEEYAKLGRPREEELIRGAAYARLRELPSQTRGFEWPPESGCPR